MQPVPQPSFPGPPPRRRDFWLPLAVALVVVLLAVRPTLGSYFWDNHELFAPLMRVDQVAEVWRAGGDWQAPWLPEICYGYGWPFFTFYAPLGSFVAAALHLLTGCSLGAAVRWSFYCSLAVGAVVVYGLVWLLGARGLLLRRDRSTGTLQPLTSTARGWLALAAATIYTLAPYHHADVFVRGSLAECWGFATFPLMMLGLELARARRLAGALLAAAGFALLMVSHNITALYGALVAVGWVLATMGRGGRGLSPWRAIDFSWVLAAAGGLALGAALSAWFWLPAMLLKSQVAVSQVDAMWGSLQSMQDHALYWRQFLREQYGWGYSAKGFADKLALNPGLAVMLGLALAAVALLRGFVSAAVEQSPVAGATRRLMRACLALSLLLLFATTWMMPWQWMPDLLRYLQFPWRLLLFVIFFGALAFALAAPRVVPRLHPLVIVALLVFNAAIVVPRLTMIIYESDFTDSDMRRMYFTREERLFGYYAGSIAREYRPSWVDPKYVDPSHLNHNPPPAARLDPPAGFTLLAHDRAGVNYHWHYRADRDLTLAVHLFDFPGWQLAIDGVPAPRNLSRAPDGLLQVDFPAGEHRLSLRYAVHPIARPARLLSLASAMAFLVLAIWSLVRALRPHPQTTS